MTVDIPMRHLWSL